MRYYTTLLLIEQKLIQNAEAEMSTAGLYFMLLFSDWFDVSTHDRSDVKLVLQMTLKSNETENVTS